jgi:hypothetical protein
VKEGPSSNELTAIGKTLDDLVERQRLSRLDTAILLQYPVLLALLGAFTNALWNYGSLQSIHVFSVTVGFLLVSMNGFLIIGLCYSLFRFLQAYLEDDFKGRLSACTSDSTIIVGLLLIQILWLVAAGSLVSGPLPEALPREYALQLELSTMPVFAVIVLIVGICFRDGLNYWLKQRVVSWSRDNIPKTFEGAQIPYASFPPKAAVAFRRLKISWAVLCLIYAAVTIAVVRAKGLQWSSGTMYCLIILAMLVGAPFCIILVRRAGVKFLIVFGCMLFVALLLAFGR